MTAERAADRLDQRLRVIDEEQPTHLRIQPALDQIVQQSLHHGSIFGGTFRKPSGCLASSPSTPIASSRVGSLVTCMPSIWITSRSSYDRSAAIHSLIRSADNATNRRDTAAFDTRSCGGRDVSSGSGTAAEAACRDVDGHQVHRPASEPVLGLRRLPNL